MKLDSVLELKQRVESSLRSEARQRGGARLQAFVDPRSEGRLAVGYSQQSPGDYLLELRVQKRGGTAHRLAERFKAEAQGEANIEVVAVVEIPSRTPSSGGEETAKALRDFGRPLHLGLSVGHENGGSGTLGAFVEDDDGEYILSNNHVLALMGQAKRKDSIYQPGGSDRWPLLDTDTVASLSRYVVLSKARRNTVDSAIAVLSEDIYHDANQIPSGFGFPMEGEMITDGGDLAELDLKKDEEVCKIGRTTGFTTGRLSAIALNNVTVKTPIGDVIFDNVIEVNWLENQPFSKPGDSGSLVFTKKGRQALGLHFAGGLKVLKGNEKIGVSYSCNLAAVLKALKVSLME